MSACTLIGDRLENRVIVKITGARLSEFGVRKLEWYRARNAARLDQCRAQRFSAVWQGRRVHACHAPPLAAAPAEARARPG